MRIERLGPGDEATVLAAGDLFDGPPTLEWTAAFLASPGHHLLLAIDGDDAIGFVTGIEMVHPDKGRELFVYELGTAAPHRRRGVASALLAALADRARELGCYGLWVATEPENQAALATYRSAGFDEAELSSVLAKTLEPS